MHAHVDGFRIGLCKRDGTFTKYGHNAFTYPLVGHNGDLSSYVIRDLPGQPIEVFAKFYKGFNLRGASGVCINIAIGHGEQDPSNMKDTQYFWIHGTDLYQQHNFSQFLRWSSETSEPTASEFTIPQPDLDPSHGSKNALWQELGIANKGCIAVSVTRGNLENGQTQLRKGRATDPPASHRLMATKDAKVICHDWFRPHEVYSHAKVTIMEFRSMDDIDAEKLASDLSEAATAFSPLRSWSVETLSHSVYSDVRSMHRHTSQRSTPATSIGDRNTPYQPHATLGDVRTNLTSTHRNGTPHSFHISTRTTPLSGGSWRATHRDHGPDTHERMPANENTSSIQDAQAGRVLGSSNNMAAPKPRNPQQASAEAFQRKQWEAHQRKIHSLHRLSTAHRRKRADSVDARNGCDDYGYEHGAKKQKHQATEVAGSVTRAPPGKQAKTNTAHANSTGHIDREDGQQADHLALKQRSRQDIDDELRELALRRELNKRDRDEASRR